MKKYEIIEKNLNELNFWVEHGKSNDCLYPWHIQSIWKAVKKIEGLGGEVETEEIRDKILTACQKVVRGYQDHLLEMVREGRGNTVMPRYLKLLGIMAEFEQHEMYLYGNKEYESKFKGNEELIKKATRLKEMGEAYLDNLAWDFSFVRPEYAFNNLVGGYPFDIVGFSNDMVTEGLIIGLLDDNFVEELKEAYKIGLTKLDSLSKESYYKHPFIKFDKPPVHVEVPEIFERESNAFQEVAKTLGIVL